VSAPYRVDSLLTLLQTEHLDPGYAAAAGAPGTRRMPKAWLAVAGVLVGTVLGASRGGPWWSPSPTARR